MSFKETFFYEFKHTFSDIAVVLTIIGGVLLYFFLYPQPYLNKTINDLKIGIIDFDNSKLSRELKFMLDSTSELKLYGYTDKKSALQGIREDKIKAFIVIPKNFAKDIANHKSPQIYLGVDNSYFLIFGTVLEGFLKSVMTDLIQQKVAYSLSENESVYEVAKDVSGFNINVINLYNKDNSYLQYVIPAVFILILQQTMLIGMGIAGGGFNERYKKSRFVFNPIYTIFSRYIIFGVIFAFYLLFYIGFGFDFYGINKIGNPLELFAFGMAFLFASLSLGMFFGSILKERELATPLVLFSSLPLVFSIGFIWPNESIPFYIKIFSYFFPSSFGIDGFLKLNQMGASFEMVGFDFVSLIGMGAVYFLGAYIKLSFLIKK